MQLNILFHADPVDRHICSDFYMHIATSQLSFSELNSIKSTESIEFLENFLVVKYLVPCWPRRQTYPYSDFYMHIATSQLSFSELNSIKSTESIEFVENYF